MPGDPLLDLVPQAALRVDDAGTIQSWNGRGRVPWLSQDIVGRALNDIAPELDGQFQEKNVGGDWRLIQIHDGAWMLVQKELELLENIAAIVWTIDSTLRIVSINGDTKLITGYTIDEILDSESEAVWARAVHPDDLRRVIETHARIFSTGEPFDIEYRYRRKDGSWVWLNDRASHVYTRNGEQFLDGVTYDITQRKVEERQQVAAADFGRRAVQTEDIRVLLDDACATIYTSLGADSCTALWRDAGQPDFEFAAIAGAPVPLPSRFADDDSILAGYAYRSDHGVTFDDLVTESRFGAPALVDAGMRSGVSAPLRGRETRYGVITAHGRQPRHFTNRECAFVETIANVAADAIDRIKTEHALASVAERYAQVVESADQGICALEDGRIVFANSAVARMMHMPAKTLLGRALETLAAPHEQQRLAEFLAAPPSPSSEKIEVELAPADGDTLWAIVTRNRAAAGGTLVLITDITDRVRAENDLRRRQVQLGDAQALAHVGSFEIDLTDGSAEWSDELYRIAGLEPQSRPIDLAFIRSRMLDDRQESVTAHLENIAAGGTSDGVHAFRRVDGTVRIVHTRVRGVTDAPTGRKRAVGIMQDLTSEIEAQRAIADREARLQIIVSRLPVILWSTGTNLRVTSMIGAGFNAVAERYFEQLNLTVSDLIGQPPEGVDLAAALQGETVSFDTLYGTRELRVHIEPLRDAGGAITGTAGIAFDRTEQLSTERVLSDIAYGAISKIGADFFRSAVLRLASVLRVDCAFIAQLTEDGALGTVAIARDGEIVENVTHRISGTPCEEVMEGAPCWIGDHVRLEYPGDPLLESLNASACAGVPIKNADGVPIGVVMVISREPLPRSAATEAALQVYADRAAVELERVQYEHSLVDEKEYVENLIDTANVVIIEIDGEGRIRLVNRAFEQLTGISRDEIEGRELLDIVSDATPMHHLITSGPHEMEASIRARDGQSRLLRFRANDVRRAGKAIGTLLFGIDITDAHLAEVKQRRLQLAIEHAAQEWRHTFDSVVTPILLLDAKRRVIRMNQAARDLSGQFAYQAALGSLLENLGEGEPFTTAARLLEESAGALTAAEARDDRGLTWSVNVMPILTPDQSPWSIVVLYDITRIVALQESVRVSEQMSAMGQLIAGVAHEVRNPLFGISAALDAFEQEFRDRADFQEYLERIRADADRLHRLMNELLEYGRPAALQQTTQSFAAVLELSVRTCMPVARQKDVEVDVRMDVVPRVRIDRDRVVQVFKNVIENAIAFTPAHSKIVVEAHEDAEAKQVVATISDGGPGLREADLPHVFDPFFTRRRGGTGLGLAIARRIVDDHRGTIAVRNGAGGGAMVEIRFPIAEGDDAAQ